VAAIRILPTQLVNKIAAGECIERPASVVKELVENSLDAGADRIEVGVEQGGTKLIRIVDNGGGIEPEQIPMAVQPHATSKITDENDLYAIGTMGFRGEALASIASVSLVRIASVTPGAVSGGEVEVIEGQPSAVRPYAGSPGTVIEIQNLFHNTPARRKFLKTSATEFGHVQEQVIRTALTFPRVAVRLDHNGRNVLELPAAEDPRDRIRDVFGPEIADGLLQVFHQDNTFTLQAYVCRPENSKPSNRWQYFFVNRRPIRDRYIAHALREAYRGLLTGDRQPVAFIFLDIDPAFVDVNVHPTKSEVRFSDSGQIHSLILGTIRDRFLSADLSARLTDEKPETEAESEETPTANADPKREELKQSVTRALADYLRTASVAQPSLNFEVPRAVARSMPTPRPAALRPGPTQPTAPPEPPCPAARQPNDAPQVQPALQIHNAYLVAETPEGFMIIDQHALHERVLYQQLKEHLQAGPIPRQRLLVPHVVNLTARQMAQIEAIRGSLEDAGIEVQPFGPRSVAVHSLPMLTDHVDASQLLEDLLQRLEDQVGPASTDPIEHVIESLACKAAVKAGDPLSPEEIQSLLEYRRKIDMISTCPHGRPTALRMTLDELKKKFKRT